jgi:hypothetical protein
MVQQQPDHDETSNGKGVPVGINAETRGETASGANYPAAVVPKPKEEEVYSSNSATARVEAGSSDR